MNKQMVGDYIIYVEPSPFVSRTGKTDITISRRSEWGRREPNGNLYAPCVKMAAEDYSVIGRDTFVPDAIIDCAKMFYLEVEGEGQTCGHISALRK